MNLSERLTGQLDSLLPFIALAHQEVFDVVGEGYEEWVPEEQRGTLPPSLELFERQVLRGAFLIGYSYVEAFLSDLARVIYLARPQMLPPQKELKFVEILSHATLEDLHRRMVDKQVRSIFQGPIEDVADHFRKKFHLPWSAEHEQVLARGSRIRNCLLHNMGRADKRLSAVSNYDSGEEIQLSSTEVHNFGWTARDLTPALWEEAQVRHLTATDET